LGILVERTSVDERYYTKGVAVEDHQCVALTARNTWNIIQDLEDSNTGFTK
jgi:hypothetical protein